jgi:hypothetical protein
MWFEELIGHFVRVDMRDFARPPPGRERTGLSPQAA